MAKFGKKHYEVLTETFGEVLGDIIVADQGKHEAVLEVAQRLGSRLELDNSGFDKEQFISNIEDIAALVVLTRKGVH